MRLFFKFCVFTLLVMHFSFGQANVTSTGISVQGIARDENNSALSNEQNLELSFKIYYLGTGNSEELIIQSTGSVNTDAFGVFATVIDISQEAYVKIANSEAYLKISQDDVVFTNEKLHAVPYALFASNGAPTGSIIAHTSNTVPNGWLKCDGNAIPSGAEYQALRDIVGQNTPDLRGMFLRGSGTADGDYATGPDVGQFQDDQMWQHRHSINLTTSSAGNHRHALPRDYGGSSQRDRWHLTTSGNDDEGLSDADSAASGYAGNHTHTVSGNTSDAGSGDENRPVNYGIVWIIKI